MSPCLYAHVSYFIVLKCIGTRYFSKTTATDSIYSSIARHAAGLCSNKRYVLHGTDYEFLAFYQVFAVYEGV